MNADQYINQSSGIVEYYTPKKWTDAARQVMGTIELDPASCLNANLSVLADRFFDKEIDGLTQDWITPALWMNHPFHKGENPCPTNREKCKKLACKKRGYHIDKAIPDNAAWINKLIQEYQCGNVKQAIIITFASTSETWFRPLLKFPQCFPDGRIHYYKPDGTIDKGVTKGSVLTYLGPNVDVFGEVFSQFGEVKISWGK